MNQSSSDEPLETLKLRGGGERGLPGRSIKLIHEKVFLCVCNAIIKHYFTMHDDISGGTDQMLRLPGGVWVGVGGKESDIFKVKLNLPIYC